MYIVYRIMPEIHGLTEFIKVKPVDLSVHLTLMNALKHRVHMSIINPVYSYSVWNAVYYKLRPPTSPPPNLPPPPSTALKGFLAGK